MKIKTKKQLNLPQLIEWAWDNGKRNLSFRGHDKEGSVVSISINENGEFTSDWRISKDQIFTVEIEKEITEDTRFEHMIEITEDDLHITWQNTKIDWEKDGESKEFHAYIGGEFKLIWTHDKGLVD